MKIVIFISGLWPTADNNGLNDLAHRVSLLTPFLGASFYSSLFTDPVVSILSTHPEDQIFLVGHSAGGDTAVKVAKQFSGQVEGLLLLDAVPAWWWVFGRFQISPNVKRALSIRKKWGLPPSCGITNVNGMGNPLGMGSGYKNQVINTTEHAQFPRLPEVVDASLKFFESFS